MVKKRIGNDKIGLGRLILLSTDSVGMDCEGAFWLYDQEQKDWQFFLVTSLLDSMGPREIYSLLDAALAKKLTEEELEKISLYITSPADPVARKLAKQHGTGRFASAPKELSASMNGHAIDAITYRLSSLMKEPDRRSTEKRFRKLSQQLACA